MAKAPVCVDCIKEGVTRWRPPAPNSGPRTQRCVTHARAEKKRISAAAHALRIVKEYGITGEQYDLLLVIQSVLLGNPPGTCAICGRSNGRTKRMAVDHDHESGRVRGIACGWCNHDVLGRLDLAAFKRAVAYLENPPGYLLEQKLVKSVITEGEE